MKFKILNVLAGALALSAAGVAVADSLSDPAFRAEVARQFPGVTARHITPSVLPGFWQVSQGGVVGYISEDGRYLIDGDAIDLDAEVNLTEQARNQWRRDKLETLKRDDLIVFSPKKTEAVVTVFTDVDCRYCRLMHDQIQDFLDAGVEVRYAFYPLSGPGSKSYQRAQAVWCSDNPSRALTEAKRGKKIKSGTGCKNPVEAQYQLASRGLRLTGTPSMITANGTFLQMAPPVSRVIEEIKANQQIP